MHRENAAVSVGEALGSRSADQTCTSGPEFSGNGNIPGDPLFENLVGGDYTLLTGSSCIDVGENRDEWMVGTLDLAGITRKQYGGVDGSKVAPKVDMGAVDRKTGIRRKWLPTPNENGNWAGVRAVGLDGTMPAPKEENEREANETQHYCRARG